MVAQMTWAKQDITVILSNPYGRTEGMTNQRIIYRMLQAMLKRQTADEQASHVTKHVNSRGFNGHDAQPLTRIAIQSQKLKTIDAADLRFVANKLKKYAGQLAEVAAENQSMHPTTVEAPTTQVEALCTSCRNAAAEHQGLCENCNWAKLKSEYSELEREQEAMAYMAGEV